MTPAATFDELYLSPALTWFAGVLPDVSVDRDAHVWALAVAGQESNWRNVRQANNGAAVGPWQMQLNDIADIMANRVTDAKAIIICTTLGVKADPSVIWSRLRILPHLAFGFMRLNLFADPHPVPAAEDAQGGWETYLRVWKPGDPRPEDWPANHAAALAAVPATIQGTPTA